MSNRFLGPTVKLTRRALMYEKKYKRVRARVKRMVVCRARPGC